MTADPGGVSALTMQKLLGSGSYQTAWTMLHRYRTAMVGPGREVLTGRVEVDETFIGGERPGPHGRGALGKSLVAVAVELHEPRGYGRARMRIIPNAQAISLREFLVATVEPGSTVVTDGWSSYRPACRDWFVHEAHPVAGSGKQANELRHGHEHGCPSAGCWAPIRVELTPSICSPTWTSSASASTVATRALGACCSTGCCSTRPQRHR